MINSISKYMLAILGLISLFSTNASAEAPKVFGFISQSYIYSDNNPLYSDQPGGHLNLRELGLTGTWQASTNLRFAGQVLSRHSGDNEDDTLTVDFILADYSFYQTEKTTLGFQLGRIKNQYGIYNSTRDVPHARPGAFVPQSVYFETYRDALLSIDGINFNLSSTNSLGDLKFNLYSGKKELTNDALEYQIYQQDIPGQFKEVSINGMKLSLKPKALSNLSLAISALDIEITLEDTASFAGADLFAAFTALSGDPSLFSNYITSLNIEGLAILYSAQYTWKEWIFTTEFLTLDSDLSNLQVLHTPYPDISTTTRGYYLQVEFQTNEHLNLFSRYGELLNNVDDKKGINYAASTGGNANTQFNTAFTLGARWYYTHNLSLTAEISHNQGAAWIIGSPGINYNQLQKSWNNLALQVSYHF